MREHGYKVQWEDKYKYITFTTPEGYKVRDNKLFDKRFLKNNLELYFAMGGCDGEMLDIYCDYVTPYHDINIEKLTPEIFRAFIKRIDVYEKEVRYSRTCGNTIVIQYTFQLDKN